MYWWAVRLTGRVLRLDGPYKDEDAAQRRADKIGRGETYTFGSMSSDQAEARVEVTEDLVRRLQEEEMGEGDGR